MNRNPSAAGRCSVAILPCGDSPKRGEVTKPESGTVNASGASTMHARTQRGGRGCCNLYIPPRPATAGGNLNQMTTMPTDQYNSEPSANAVRCGDLVCDGVEAGVCQSCYGAKQVQTTEWPPIYDSCTDCNGTGRIRVIPDRSHTGGGLCGMAPKGGTTT